jgi:hypothetical protein
MTALKIDERPGSGPTKSVLEHLFQQYGRLRVEQDAVAERALGFVQAIELLLKQLSPADREAYEARFEALKRGERASRRGTQLHENVVMLFERNPQREMGVGAIQKELERVGFPTADQKAIHNILNYLASSGRLRRVGRGRYLLHEVGAEIEFDDKADGTERNSEHFT